MGRLTAPVYPLLVIDFYEFPYVFGTGWAGLVYDKNGLLIGLCPGKELGWRGIYNNRKVTTDLLRMVATGEAKLLKRTTYVSDD